MFITVRDLGRFSFDEYQIRLDVDVLRRILWKLVLNSLQSTKEGLVHISIARRASDKNAIGQKSPLDRLEIVVEDTGKGMNEDFVRGERYQEAVTA